MFNKIYCFVYLFISVIIIYLFIYYKELCTKNVFKPQISNAYVFQSSNRQINLTVVCLTQN